MQQEEKEEEEEEHPCPLDSKSSELLKKKLRSPKIDTGEGCT